MKQPPSIPSLGASHFAVQLPKVFSSPAHAAATALTKSAIAYQTLRPIEEEFVTGQQRRICANTLLDALCPHHYISGAQALR